MLIKKLCAYEKCKKLFYGPASKRYCCKQCAYKAYNAVRAIKSKACKWCGTLTPNENKFCCEDCEQFYIRAKTANQPKPKKDFLSIEEMVKLAREAGLSYGQYEGQKYLQNRKDN